MISDLQERLSASIGRSVELRPIDASRTQVHVPFEFADGDELVIHLRSLDDGSLEWTDMGHTYLHLSYRLDPKTLEAGPRAAVIQSVRSRFDVDAREGELVRPSSEATLGEDLFRFSQALIEVADLRTHSRERIRDTFRDDLARVIESAFPGRVDVGWHDPVRDPEGLYSIDLRINHIPRPIALFGVTSDKAAGDATITLLKLREWGSPVFAAAVHAEMSKIGFKGLGRLTDTVDKQWSALSGHEDDIVEYLRAEIARQER